MRHLVAAFFVACALAWHPRLVAAEVPPIDRAALAKLVERGRETHSNALLVWQNGKLVLEEYFGLPRKREPLMSCTKSVVALAVAKLVDDGKLTFDQHVSELYPEWRQGRKRDIRVRDLLAHTSGLQNYPTTDVEIYPAPDIIKLALAAELSDAPGEAFSYNNKAVNLLAGIIQIASGERMDRYILGKLLRPLGIDGKWEEIDKSGNPYAMSGLYLTGADFLKLGRLVLGNGAVDGKRVISERSMQALLAASEKNPGYGLLWWRIPRWHYSVVDAERLAEMKRAGVDASFVAAMATLKERRLGGEAEIVKQLQKLLGSNWRERYSAARAKTRVFTEQWSPDLVGYKAEGYLGEYLFIMPAADLVAVRLVEGSERHTATTDGFEDFIDDVRKLVEPAAAAR